MIIPDSIQLLGHTIKIEWCDTLIFEHDALGISDYRNNKIMLQRPNISQPVPTSVVHQVYLHELMHFVFSYLGRHDLKDDEQLVDGIAGLLNQALVQEKRIPFV